MAKTATGKACNECKTLRRLGRTVPKCSHTNVSQQPFAKRTFSWFRS